MKYFKASEYYTLLNFASGYFFSLSNIRNIFLAVNAIHFSEIKLSANIMYVYSILLSVLIYYLSRAESNFQTEC